MEASRVPLLAALAAALSCLLLLPSHQRTAILDSCTAWQSIGCLSVLEPARENVKGGGNRNQSFDDPLCLNASAGVGGAEGVLLQYNIRKPFSDVVLQQNNPDKKGPIWDKKGPIEA